MSWGETCHPFYDDKHRVTEVTPPRLLQQKKGEYFTAITYGNRALYCSGRFLDGFVDIDFANVISPKNVASV